VISVYLWNGEMIYRHNWNSMISESFKNICRIILRTNKRVYSPLIPLRSLNSYLNQKHHHGLNSNLRFCFWIVTPLDVPITSVIAICTVLIFTTCSVVRLNDNRRIYWARSMIRFHSGFWKNSCEIGCHLGGNYRFKGCVQSRHPILVLAWIKSQRQITRFRDICLLHWCIVSNRLSIHGILELIQ
jgi:hypothetical protein